MVVAFFDLGNYFRKHEKRALTNQSEGVKSLVKTNRDIFFVHVTFPALSTCHMLLCSPDWLVATSFSVMIGFVANVCDLKLGFNLKSHKK